MSIEKPNPEITILPRPPRKRRRRQVFLWRRLAVLLAFAVFVVLLSRALWRHFSQAGQAALGPSDMDSVLVVGVSGADEHSDLAFIQLLSLDRRNHWGYVLGIPPQTQALVGDRRGTLATAWAQGGMPLLEETVTALTTLAPGHTAQLTPQGLQAIFKVLGSQEVALAAPVKFKAENFDLALDLPAGRQRLTPEQAAAYAWEGNSAPLEPLMRQQRFFHAWQSDAQGFFSGLRFKGLISGVANSVKSDLSPGDLETLMGEWRALAPARTVYATLPGMATSRGDWQLDSAPFDALMTELKTLPVMAPIEETHPTLEIRYADPAGDEPVMALATRLTQAGFQVIRTARGPVESAETRLLDHSGPRARSLLAPERASQAVGDCRVVLAPDAADGYSAQYTLELGQSYFRR
jgi:anionic cell wall polymer biosynthesis LytR-Cps2A-Psr (LCP) family protein